MLKKKHTEDEALNTKKRAVIKNFIDYEAYYPEASMFKTSDGYVKAWYLKDMDDAETNEGNYVSYVFNMCLSCIPDEGVCQICHINDRDVFIMSIPADSPEEAIVLFEAMNVPLDEVPMREWFSLITEVSRFSEYDMKDKVGEIKYDKKERSKGAAYKLKDTVQPFQSPAPKKADNNSKYYFANDECIESVILSNFPSFICPSLLTDIIKISDKIQTSLYIKSVDKRKCLLAINNYGAQCSKYITEQLNSDEPLYHVCLIISAHGESKEEVSTIISAVKTSASRYLAKINLMNYEQYPTWRSMAPLGKSYIRCYKTVTGEMVSGLLPFSWTRHLDNTIYYGKNTLMNTPLYYNRLAAKTNGFILSSDNDFVDKRVANEIEQMMKANPDLKVRVFTLDASLLPTLSKKYKTREVRMPIITGGSFDYEAVKVVTTCACTTTGRLPQDKKEVMKAALDSSPKDFSEYVSLVKEQNPQMAQKLSFIDKGYAPTGKTQEHVSIDQIGNTNDFYALKLGMLVQAVASCDADVVYVLAMDAFLNISSALTKYEMLNPDTIWTWSVVSHAQGALRKTYLNENITDKMQHARFLDISQHKSTDRVALRSVFDFDTEGKNIIAANNCNKGILILNGITYYYENET